MLTEKEYKLVENYIYKIAKKAINEEEEPKKSKKNANRRKLVIKWLKQDSVNNAAIMRSLWNIKNKKDEDAARSLFSKKLNHAPNDNGVPYDFSEDEITRLFNIKSGNE